MAETGRGGAVEVDYDGISNRLRKEKQSGAERLTKLEPTFYYEAEQYLRHLGDEAHRENEANAAGAKATLLLDELRNARRALDDFYDLREHKILALAMGAARGATPDAGHMTRGELELFEHLARILRDARRTMLKHGERLPGEEAPPAAAPIRDTLPAPPPERPLAIETAPAPLAADAARAPPAPAPAPAPLPGVPAGPAAASEGSVSPAPPAPSASPKTARVLVRVLEDVPQFLGSDMRTYRLGADDVVALPKEQAKVLVLRGKATYVTPT